jgi:hypothetical protein
MANHAAYFATRQRGGMSAHGLAMSCEVRTLCAIGLLVASPITGGFHGITVPIFRDPVLNE